MITITEGIDVPIAGAPSQTDIQTKLTDFVALVGSNYIGMMPSMRVKVGEKVKKGQILWGDKKILESYLPHLLVAYSRLLIVVTSGSLIH